MATVKIYGESLEPRKHDKVLFQGDEDSAREYVENNYPRHHGHVESPEVYVENDNGNVEHYYGGKWLTPGDEPTAKTVDETNPFDEVENA